MNYLIKIFTFSYSILLTFVQIVAAEDISATWTDFNYVPCEGIGIHGSGKIKARASITRNANSISIKSLQITSSHPQASGFSSNITFIDDAAKKQSITLVAPWYPTIGPQGDKFKVLPRNKTTASPGPSEQTEIFIGDDQSITVIASILFTSANGNCAASFSQNWKL